MFWTLLNRGKKGKWKRKEGQQSVTLKKDGLNSLDLQSERASLFTHRNATENTTDVTKWDMTTRKKLQKAAEGISVLSTAHACGLTQGVIVSTASGILFCLPVS